MVLLSTVHIISIFRKLHVGKSICFGLIICFIASCMPPHLLYLYHTRLYIDLVQRISLVSNYIFIVRRLEP